MKLILKQRIRQIIITYRIYIVIVLVLAAISLFVIWYISYFRANMGGLIITDESYDSNNIDSHIDIDNNNVEEEKAKEEATKQDALVNTKPKAPSSSNSSSQSEVSQSDSGVSPEPEPEPEPESESFSAFVAFYADNQSDSDDDDVRHQNVVNRILASGANPVIHAGDLMEDGTQNSFDRFVDVAGGLLGSRTFYGALGNNDRLFGDSTTPSPIFLDYFNFPNNEKWYSVNSGNLHVVVLDSAFSASEPSQISWLASDLQSAASQSRITAVVFHHPTFFSTIQSYLINYGVDFVACGHVHTYIKNDINEIEVFTLPGGTVIGHATAEVYSSYVNFKAYNQSGDLIEISRIENR